MREGRLQIARQAFALISPISRLYLPYIFPTSPLLSHAPSPNRHQAFALMDTSGDGELSRSEVIRSLGLGLCPNAQ